VLGNPPYAGLGLRRDLLSLAACFETLRPPARRNPVYHRPISEHGQVKAMSVERDQLWPQLSDPFYKCADQLRLRALADVGRTERVNAPSLRLAAGD
jgi:hypothetical protein